MLWDYLLPGFSSAMLIGHLVISYLSFFGRVVSRGFGVPWSLYEAFYYVFIVSSFLSLIHVSLFALAVGILFLIIHLPGAYLYLRGFLGALASRGYLRLYGVYELVESSYLLYLVVLFLLPLIS